MIGERIESRRSRRGPSGTFENASFYDYDEQGHRIKGLHFNAPNLINRNSFHYDAKEG